MVVCILYFICLLSGVLSLDHEEIVTAETTVFDITIPDTTEVNPNSIDVNYNCNQTNEFSVSRRYNLLTESMEDLDDLSNRTLVSSSSFILQRSQMFCEIALNYTKKYINDSKIFLDAAKELNSTIIHCLEEVNYDKFNTDFIEAYEQRLELIQSLLDELENMTNSQQEILQDDLNPKNEIYNGQLVKETIIMQIAQLHKIINFSSEIRKLKILMSKYWKSYWNTDNISDLENIISITKQTIPLYYQILETIDVVSNFSTVNDILNVLKSNLTEKLINITDWRLKLTEREKFLRKAEKRYAEDMSLLVLKDVVRPTVLGILFFSGIIGNGILLIVFVRYKDMRISTNIMVINLTIADVLCLIVNVPLYILETHTPWTYGDALCKCYRFSRFLTIGLSVYSVVVISMQRYSALTSLKKSGRFGYKLWGEFKPVMIVIVVWIIAGALASPRAVKAFQEGNECKSGRKEDNELFLKPMIIFDFIIYCICPLIIVSITSAISSKELKKSVRNMPGEVIGRENAVRARVLSSNILLALTIVFAISYVPYFSYLVYDYWFPLNVTYIIRKYISFFFYALIFSNACINPIALYLVSRKYRRYMNNCLFCRSLISKRKNSTETNATSTTTVETKM